MNGRPHRHVFGIERDYGAFFGGKKAVYGDHARHVGFLWFKPSRKAIANARRRMVAEHDTASVFYSDVAEVPFDGEHWPSETMATK